MDGVEYTEGCNFGDRMGNGGLPTAPAESNAVNNGGETAKNGRSGGESDEGVLVRDRVGDNDV